MFRSLLAAALISVSAAAVEVEGPPTDKTVAEEVHDISFLMLTIESRLRDDNIDHSVQIDSKEVIARIEKIIKDAEEEESSQKSKGKKDGKKPGKDSDLTDHKRIMPLKENTIYDDGTRDIWARLPREQRGEIVQTWAKDYPLRWQQRIAAYFLSINAAESATHVKKK